MDGNPYRGFRHRVDSEGDSKFAMWFLGIFGFIIVWNIIKAVF